MTYDILIRGGAIVDGSGRPRFTGDIGIANGLIRAVGAPTLQGASAGGTISAGGKIVSPGFIDITSHADKNFSLFQNPEQGYLLAEGVTSILVGNCGTSLAPLPSSEAADAMKKWNEGGAVSINWATVAEFLAELGRRGLGVNVGTLVGHGTIRRGILHGRTARLSTEELAQVQAQIEQGVREGAFGLSAGLVYSHEVDANADELAAFLRVLAEARGIWKVHLRHEGVNLLPAANEVVQLARETPQVPVVISHFKAVGRKAWAFFPRIIEMIDRANADGANIHFDFSPYVRTGSFLYLLLPRWAREGGFAAMLARIANPSERGALLEDMRRQTLHPERYLVANSDTPGTNGQTIAAVAERAGTSAEEAILDLIAASRGRVTVFGKTLSITNIRRAAVHPLAILASDGSGVYPELERSGKLVHPRSTSAFPRFLRRFVRETSLLTLEDAIRKMTSLPASVAGIAGRGLIAEKYHADLVILDPETIRDRATYENPYVSPIGIDAVIVNGKIAFEGGSPTAVAAGQVLRKTT